MALYRPGPAWQRENTSINKTINTGDPLSGKIVEYFFTNVLFTKRLSLQILKTLITLQQFIMKGHGG